MIRVMAIIITITVTLVAVVTSQTRQQEQDHFRIERIEVQIGGQFTSGEVLVISGLNQGSIASPEVLEMARKRLLTAYNNRGCIQANVIITSHFKAPMLGEMRNAEVLVKIQEGPMFVLRRLEFTGNKTTRDRIVRRRVLLNEGEPYSEDLLEASLERINQLGLFVPLLKRDVRKEVDGKQRIVDLRIHLTEKRKR